MVAGNHGHEHEVADYGTAFLIGIFLNAAFIAIEVAFGVLSGSLALLADAGHNLSDVLGLVMAWGANALSRRSPSIRRTYGWKRSTVLAALFNALLLLVGVGAIAWEAIERFHNPPAIRGSTVIWVAALGILVNGATALIFMSGRKRDLNVRGAFLHMASDAVVSAAVMLAGAAMLVTGWAWLDPMTSLVVAGVILWSTWGLFADALNLSLDAVPESIDPGAVRAYLAELPEVEDVHHLHIWPLSTTEVALTAHLVKTSAGLDNALLRRIGEDLSRRFGIAHPTIQFETAEGRCECE